MTRSSEAAREIVRWACALTCWHLAHDNVIVLVLVLIASTRFVARTTTTSVPPDAVRIRVAGAAEHVKA